MKTKKTTTAIATALGLSLAPGGFAQQKKIDIEERRRSVVNLEQHIADREERLGMLGEDIIRLDSRVETQIDKIVGRLKSIEDSKDSQVSVAQTKQEAIAGLRRTIEYYVRKRDGLKEQLKKETAIPKETLADDLGKFNERIEKRVGQIIDISKSFTEYEELDKYETWTEERWRRTDTKYRISDDWRHNRKSVRHTESQRKEIAEAIDKDIERLERRSADLKEKLRSTTLSSGLRLLHEEDLQQNEATIALRKEQSNDLSTSYDRAPTTPIGRAEAHTIDLGLRDAAKDLREDFFAIFEKYDELNKEREQIAKLKANLDARKAWLKENAPG